MKNFQKSILCFSLIFPLSGCKIAGEKRDGTSPSAIMAYFEYEQSAFHGDYTLGNDAQLRKILSSFYGLVVVADSEATFASVLNPELGCRAIVDDGIPMNIVRSINPGALIIEGDDIESIEVPLINDKPQYFLSQSFLPFGRYRMRIEGAIALEQSFKVMSETAPEILISSGTFVNQTIPSPEVDQSHVVRISRSNDLKISFQAPPEADFVRVKLVDARDPQAGVVCYGKASEELEIEAAALSELPATDKGALTIDFLANQSLTDLPRIKESFFQTYTRHRHGMIYLPKINDDGERVMSPLSLGTLRFE